MSMRTVELVSEWDSVPFDGGYEGLRTLSDQGFSGAVTTGSTQLFMLNGTVVGILDGAIEAFESADGSARAAPHDALPLLVVMQDRADSPRAQYYTEDTPIAEVDRTLEDGKFTGFVELSENVLSGDYYLVYHQGRSMSVAWVGNSKRLVTDEDAFEQADGEVGIYKVMPAAIEPVEIPEPPEPSGTDEGAATGGTAGATAADDAPTEDETEATDDAKSDTAATPVADEPSEPTTDVEPTPTTDDNPTVSAPAETSDPADSGTASVATTDVTERGNGGAGPPGSKAAGASQGTAVDRQQREEPDAGDDRQHQEESEDVADRQATEVSPEATVPETESEPPASTKAAVADTEPVEPETTEPAADVVDSSESRTEQPETSTTATEQTGDTQTAASATDSDAVGVLETRSIPSLDPERSSSTPEKPPTELSSQQSTSSQSTPPATESTSTRESAAPTSTQSGTETATKSTDEGGSAPSTELQGELAEREEQITELESEIADLSTENEELAVERDRLLSELEEARAEIQRLEEELAAAGGAAPSGQTLSATEAIDGTNLFVRYHSKGEATLAKAQDGSVDRASVEENLRLEHHTQFDGDDTVVDGDAFEEFLQDSIHYRFVDWLVGSLLYEIRDTGHESAMGVLYDALPEVDRAELNGKVSVTYTEDGQEHRTQEQFDVVVRDRMGNPLVVANINDSRQPATEGQMTDIVRNAERVGNASDSLAGAFLVTNSFFEPEALETAKEATSSGLFNRDKRKSFVNLSRKGGYHLCLLEARNREFHLAVPEL